MPNSGQLAGISNLLQILAGQNRPIDPRAGLLADLITSGNLPEDQLTTTLNTALDFASPSASRDLVEGFGGPSALGATLGLSPEEANALIRQSVGLQISPGQKLESQTSLLGLLPDFISKQQELEIKQQEANTKQQEADDKKAKAAADATLAQKQLAFDIENATPEQLRQTFDLNLRTMVLNGMTLDGKTVDRDARARAQRLLSLGQQIPGLSAFIQGLVEEGDFETAGQVLGLPPDSVKNNFELFGPNTERGDGPLVPGLGTTPTAITGPEVSKNLDDAVNQWLQALQSLIGGQTGNF